MKTRDTSRGLVRLRSRKFKVEGRKRKIVESHPSLVFVLTLDFRLSTFDFFRVLRTEVNWVMRIIIYI